MENITDTVDNKNYYRKQKKILQIKPAHINLTI